MWKKVRNILLLTISVIMLLNITLVVLVNISSVQSKIVGYITDWVSSKTKTEASIGRVDIDLFNGLFIDELYLEDQAGDTLLYAKRLSANASILSAYYKDKLHLRNVTLSDFKVYLSKDSVDSPFNFQFLVDAFASSDTTDVDATPSKFDLSIGEIRLTNGAFRYDIKSDSLTPNLFNPSHIHIDGLMAELYLNSIHLEKMEAGVESLSLRDWSGFVLQNLEAKAKVKDSVITADRLLVQLPNTHFEVGDIKLLTPKNSMETHLVEGLSADLKVLPSLIYPPDLKAFLPQLSFLRDTLGISAHLSANLPAAQVMGMNFYYGNNLLSSADASVSDVCHLDSATLNFAFRHLFVASDFADEMVKSFVPTMELPDVVEKLNYAELSLFAHGLLDSLKVDLNLASSPGNLKAVGKVGYNLAKGDLCVDVDLESEGLKTEALLDTAVGLREVALRTNVALSLSNSEGMDVRLSGLLPAALFKEYPYHDIDLKAHYFGQNSLELDVAILDTNVNLSINGRVLNISSDSMDCDLMVKVDRLSPYNLHLVGEDMQSFLLSTRVNLQAHGNSLDNLVCRLQLDSTYMQTDTMNLLVEKFAFSVADNRNGGHRVDLEAPYFSVNVDGKYDISSIVNAFSNHLQPYLPTFFSSSEGAVDLALNDFKYAIRINNTERISRILKLPLLVDQPASISGRFSPASSGMMLKAEIPSMKWSGNVLSNTTLDAHLDSVKKMYLLDLNTQLRGAERDKIPLNLNLHTEADHDVILLSLLYDNSPDEFKLKGQFLSLVSFLKEANDDLCVKMNFMPTDLTLNDLTVEVEPAVIEMRPKNITLSDFGFSIDGHPFIMANGRLSESRHDSLLVSFHRASVHHLLSSVKRQDIPVDAYLDGTIHLYSLLGSPRFYMKEFHLDDIAYQDINIGSLTLNSRWSTKHQGMRVGAVLNREGEIVGSADGHLSPVKNSVHIEAHFDKVPLFLAELPLKGVVHNLSGFCGTDLQVGGKLSAPEIDGYFYFKDAQATIDFTDVTYRLSDTILFSPNRIMFRDFDIYDSKNKRLNINCAVHHKDFTNFKYTATLRMDDLMLLNNPNKKDSLLYGKFFASGVVDVRGDMNAVKVTGSLKNEDRTSVMIRLPESVTEVRTYDNIVYITPASAQDSFSKKKKPVPKIAKNFSINADVSVELTNDALFGAIISPTTGDAISFSGAGNIDVKYDSEISAIKLLGQYAINKGTLKLKLSQLPIKTFTLKEGGKVYFNGDPTACSMDITAGYRVRADLALLDPSFSSMGLPSTRVPVECDLNISGNLKKFDIKYDISLPEANEDLARTVNSVITTDDIRIREFAYLLGFGMFYPPNGQTDGNSSIVSSLASSSLSGALNGALSGLLGDRVTIGTDLSSSQQDLSDLEMNVSVSTNFFNNRLVFNSSLGYKNNSMAEAAENDNALVSNFDAEYKLTKSGMFRLKAYNHANNEFYNSSSTTQGLGVVFVKEAKRFNGLFNLRPNVSPSSSILQSEVDELQPDSALILRNAEESSPKEVIKSEER